MHLMFWLKNSLSKELVGIWMSNVSLSFRHLVSKEMNKSIKPAIVLFYLLLFFKIWSKLASNKKILSKVVVID